VLQKIIVLSLLPARQYVFAPFSDSCC